MLNAKLLRQVISIIFVCVVLFLQLRAVSNILPRTQRFTQPDDIFLHDLDQFVRTYSGAIDSKDPLFMAAFGKSGSDSLGKAAHTIPLGTPLPPSPTAYEMAEIVSHEEVVREILELIAQGTLEGHPPKINLRTGFFNGVTLGILDPYDIETPYFDAVLRLRSPFTTSEIYRHIIGFLLGLSVWWWPMWYFFGKLKTKVIR